MPRPPPNLARALHAARRGDDGERGSAGQRRDPCVYGFVSVNVTSVNPFPASTTAVPVVRSALTSRLAGDAVIAETYSAAGICSVMVTCVPRRNRPARTQ